jgi:hypothetical protein
LANASQVCWTVPPMTGSWPVLYNTEQIAAGSAILPRLARVSKVPDVGL